MNRFSRLALACLALTCSGLVQAQAQTVPEPASPYRLRHYVRSLVVVDSASDVSAQTGRVLLVQPAVNGKTRWSLEADGPLVLSSAGAWTITTSVNQPVNVKLWGAGGGAGGLDAGPEMAGQGGGAGYVAGGYVLSPSVKYTFRVGGGGGGGLTDVSGHGAGEGGWNGGGMGAPAGAVGTSGAGGGGGGRTELLQDITILACAGGGGGGGGDGYVGVNTGTDGNALSGTISGTTGATPPAPATDGGGAGGGGGGCPGGAAASRYPYRDANGPGGAAGANSAGVLTNASAQVAGASRLPANGGDADNGGAGAGGTVPGGRGASGRIVIR